MNRKELADTIVSGTQNAACRLKEIGHDLFNEDISPVLSDYDSPSYCRCKAQLVRLRADQAAALVAQLHAHAGMLEALSHCEAPDDPELPQWAGPGAVQAAPS